MARKKYDLAVKTGSYVDRDGKTKNRYQNIGVVMQGDNGFYALLDPLINLAAVPREEGKDRVMVSMFEPRDDAQQQAPQRQQRPAPVDDDIPF